MAILAARALAALCVASLVFGSLGWCQERAPEEPRPFPRRGAGPLPDDRGEWLRSDGGGRGDGGGPRGYFEWPLEATATKGFLFVNGEYLPGPYEIRYAEGAVTVNGRKLTCLPTRTMYGGRGAGYGPPGFGPPGFGASRTVHPWRPMVTELSQQLSGDSIVMSFPEQPLVAFNSSGATYDLLKHLTGQGEAKGSNSGSISQVSFLQQLPEGFDRTVWNDWITDFEAPKGLVDRGSALIAIYDETERDALAAIAARKRLDAWAYPLTVGLMVVTVLALGHLLGGRPHAGRSTVGTDDSPEMMRALSWSLIFVAVLSVSDLVLTLLASQAGQMLEMNPLGSHLMRDPRHLFGFKVGATLPSIGLLWLLRRHKRAQVAAWWICLILVIVTFRWLMINSTFMAA